MGKNKVGRPISVYTPERLKEIKELMLEYMEDKEIPIFAEFAYLNDLDRSELYKHPELSHTIRRMMSKKEAGLEKKGLDGDAPASMVIFSLKQLGWSDKQEIEHSGEVKRPVIVSLGDILEN